MHRSPSPINVQPLPSSHAHRRPENAGPGAAWWWGTLLVAVVGVSTVTAAVALLFRSAGPSRSSFAGARDVPSEINGHPVQTEFGQQLFMQNCSSCHGVDAAGMPRQGANLRESPFLRRLDDGQVVSFLRVGRRPGERDTVLNLTMPPRGGNASLEDAELADIVAYLRLVQKQHATARPLPSRAGVLGVAGSVPGR